jgi:hypothetical protein
VGPKGWTTYHVDDRRLADLDVPPEQAHRLLARAIKLRPDWFIPSYGSFDFVLWIDGNIEFLQDPLTIFQDLVVRPKLAPDLPYFACFSHHERSSMSQELSAIVRMRPNEIFHLETLEAYCRRVKFPDDLGLSETCVILRSVNPLMDSFSKKWWELLIMCGVRDQVVLPLTLHLFRDTLRPSILRFRWRASEGGDMHVKDWPKAPWFHRLEHAKTV